MWRHGLGTTKTDRTNHVPFCTLVRCTFTIVIGIVGNSWEQKVHVIICIVLMSAEALARDENLVKPRQETGLGYHEDDHIAVNGVCPLHLLNHSPYVQLGQFIYHKKDRKFGLRNQVGVTR